MRLDVVAKASATVILVVVSTGSIIANHDCLFLDCGSGSKRCFAGAGSCNYCDGVDPVDMCAIVENANCNELGNIPCGNNYANGKCVYVPGFFRGTCGKGVPDGNPCSVLGC